MTASLQSRAKRLATLTAVAVGLLLLVACGGWAYMVRMPGSAYDGPLPAITATEQTLSEQLRAHVTALSVSVGERHHERPAALRQAADYVAGSLQRAGLAPKRRPFDADGMTFENIEASIQGQSGDEVVIVGAHYDSAYGTPAANDNGSGVAAMLALAKAFAAAPAPKRTLRFVGFSNEEPPHFQTSSMGSLVYAKQCRKTADNIVAMISLETMGYYSDAPNSQHYPPPMDAMYPSTGNFIGFVSDTGSRALLHEVLSSFRLHSKFPSEGASLPAVVPGVGWSDHWSFWQVGYPAVMVSDTAPFRYPHYHTAEDTVDKLDFERFARVVAGLQLVVNDLVNPAPTP